MVSDADRSVHEPQGEGQALGEVLCITADVLSPDLKLF